MRSPSGAGRWLWLAALLAAGGCSDSERSGVDGGESDADVVDADGSDGPLDAGGSDAGPLCGCETGLHNDHIVVVSDDAELWSYDPMTGEFELIGGASCFGNADPFSMAIDARGIAWIVYIESEDVFTLDVNDPGRCEDPGYIPGRDGFGVFGMAFNADETTTDCEDLYLFSYSGDGPFREGEDLGRLGILDTETLSARTIGSIDFDGGELSGTADGRLFAFTGNEPAKLVEYDPETAEPIEIRPLEGFSKTNASAFAQFAGDFWFFTERVPPECEPCLESTCSTALADCRADETCAEHLACVLEQADFRDDCGGLLTEGMVDCVMSCDSECLVRPAARVSEVTRLDFDESDGGGREVVGDAPIRVVGAGVSTCVPTIPI